MKKIVLRSVLIAALLTGVVALLVWYWTMKREVPAQARVIPSDAFAVLTLNVRELARDRAGEEHLFPEMMDKGILENELAPFTRAITANGATGVAEMADILLFTYHSGDAGFFGIAVELEDSAVFGELMRVHVAKEFNISPLSFDGIPVMRFDTTAAAFGWTEDAALFLYPIGNHGIATVSTQCIKLLKQQKENSVMANENFCAMEQNTFSMDLWIQTQPFLNFSGGGKITQFVSGIQYFNYLAEFEDGKILVRSEWHLGTDVDKDDITEIPFPCEAKEVVGFIRTHIDPASDTLYERYTDTPPLENLPLSDEELLELIPHLTGNCMMIAHDTTLQRMIAFDNYDLPADTINYVAGAESYCFEVANEAKVRALITSVMERDSIPLTPRGWNFGDFRLILTEKMLTYTNHNAVDGRNHSIPPELAGYMAWFDLQRLFANEEMSPFGFFLPGTEANTLLSEHLVSFSNTIPVQFGTVRQSQLTLTFKNEDVNGLIQLEEIARKIYSSR